MALYNSNKGAGPTYSNAAYQLVCTAEEGGVTSGAAAAATGAVKGPNHWQAVQVAARAAAAEAAKSPLTKAREAAAAASAAAAAAVAKAEALERETADSWAAGQLDDAPEDWLAGTSANGTDGGNSSREHGLHSASIERIESREREMMASLAREVAGDAAGDAAGDGDAPAAAAEGDAAGDGDAPAA